MKTALFLAIAAVVLWCSYRVGRARGETTGILLGLERGKKIGWSEARRMLGGRE